MDKPGYRTDYETVAASQTAQVLGPVGGIGDVLEAVTIIPTTTSPGSVSIKDGGDAAIVIFNGGAASVADLKALTVTFGTSGIRSRTGAWQITTGANVAAVASGRFR